MLHALIKPILMDQYKYLIMIIVPCSPCDQKCYQWHDSTLNALFESTTSHMHRLEMHISLPKYENGREGFF